MNEYLIQFAQFMFGALTVIKLLLLEFENLIVMIKNLKKIIRKK
jgi:hypothetical protein